MEKKINLNETVEYKEFGFQIIKCPVCQKDTLDNNYICPTCGWEYDGLIDNKEESIANDGLTIVPYRKLKNL